MQLVHEGFWQADVLNLHRFRKQRCNLPVLESGDAAADAGDIEEQFGMLTGEYDEIIHVRLDGIHTSLHRGNAIALSLQTNALSPDGSERPIGNPRRSATKPGQDNIMRCVDIALMREC
jgi:hypothetical protein